MIVEVLQRRGFHVDRVSAPGFPDLVISKWVRARIADRPVGHVWFAEVKRPKGRYTAKQIEWRAKWQGPEPYRLESVEDAIAFPERRDVATEARKPSTAARPSKSKRKKHGAVFPEQVTT